MKFKYLILLIIFIIVVVLFKYFTNKDSSDYTDKESNSNSSNKIYTVNDLDHLHSTNNFLHSAIKHIFLGSVNSNGKVDGYHYDDIKNIDSFVIQNTKTHPNKYGVYKAKTIIDGKIKNDDNGHSTFFPNNYSPQQVIDVINQAYSNKHHIDKNIYLGKATNGMEIEMYITYDSKIISAFPKY
ncbi:MAG: EndoU domain-containing protein [Sarcina sp.]